MHLSSWTLITRCYSHQARPYIPAAVVSIVILGQGIPSPHLPQCRCTSRHAMVEYIPTRLEWYLLFPNFHPLYGSDIRCFEILRLWCVLPLTWVIPTGVARKLTCHQHRSEGVGSYSHSAALWGQQWKHTCVCFKSDNMAAVEIIKKRTAKDTLLMHLLRCMVQFSVPS